MSFPAIKLLPCAGIVWRQLLDWPIQPIHRDSHRQLICLMIGDEPQIWLVDDDRGDQFLIKQALNWVSSQLAIKLISDGDELLPPLQEAAMLPILLSLNMERMNGFEALQEVLNCSPYQDVPVVMLTTSDVEEDRRKALQLGANDFLTKPSRFDAVVTMLRQLATDWQLIN